MITHPRIALALSALALAAAAPPATAAGDSTFTGDCGYTVPTYAAPVHNWEEAGTRTIAITLVVAVHSPEFAPRAADVSCDLRVNGVSQHVVGPVRVVGAGAAAAVTTFTTTHRWDELVVCTVVDFADATPDREECPHTTSMQFPPYEVYELLDGVLDLAEPACPYVGDVYVGHEWLYDCDGPA